MNSEQRNKLQDTETKLYRLRNLTSLLGTVSLDIGGLATPQEGNDEVYALIAAVEEKAQEAVTSFEAAIEAVR